MDALYDAPNTKVRIIEHIISRFTKELWRNDSRNISSFVMKEQGARDCYIREKDVAIEIQDGFNNNLVIQHYMEKGKKKKNYYLYSSKLAEKDYSRGDGREHFLQTKGAI